MHRYALLAVFAAAACTGPDRSDTTMKAMVGASEPALLAAMGRAPDVSVDTALGTKRLQWRWQKAFAISNPTLGYTYSGGVSRPIPHSTTGMVREECVAEWTVENGIAASYHEEGSACPASRPSRSPGLTT